MKSLIQRLTGRGATPRKAEYAVLMVCMGNICRSPTAEAVLRHKLREAGLHERVHVDSAGTHGYHTGAPPDGRAQTHAGRRGYDLSALRARRVSAADFEAFDLLLAMDRENLEALHALAPAGEQGRARRLLEFATPSPGSLDVPDPYYGSTAGFERVLDLVEAGCDGLIATLRRELATPRDAPGD
jgi:protein-tyrosine phosphatase